MPRKPRVFLPSVPCHVISRGNNRDVCFYTDQDYFFIWNAYTMLIRCLFQKRCKVGDPNYTMFTDPLFSLGRGSTFSYTSGCSGTICRVTYRLDDEFIDPFGNAHRGAEYEPIDPGIPYPITYTYNRAYDFTERLGG